MRAAPLAEASTATFAPGTGLTQASGESAQGAVRLLLALIDGAGPVGPVILPARLVVRESA